MLHWISERACALAALLVFSIGSVQAGDIYGYVDERGVAQFASEPRDARYQLFFRDGQSFDTANGVAAPRGKGASPAARALLSTFNASPGYKSAKLALREASRTHDIDIELLQAVIATESGFDPEAISPKGAVGLMQLMPTTAQRFGVRADASVSIERKLMDPKLNIATGARYLRVLLRRFSGRTDLALAAYNAGEGAVQRAGNRIPNYPETRNYVSTVLQLYAYLKPATAVMTGVGGKVPQRVRMELGASKGGAVGRGNMPLAP